MTVPKTALRERACALKRADPTLTAAACATQLGVNATTVQTWWQQGGLTWEYLGEPALPPDPFIDLLHVDYRGHDADVSDEWREVGLSRWAYVPPRADTAVPRVSEWVL